MNTFIFKNKSWLERFNYIIYDNKTQAYKEEGKFGVLITEIASKFLFLRTISIIIYIKRLKDDSVVKIINLNFNRIPEFKEINKKIINNIDKLY